MARDAAQRVRIRVRDLALEHALAVRRPARRREARRVVPGRRNERPLVFRRQEGRVGAVPARLFRGGAFLRSGGGVATAPRRTTRTVRGGAFLRGGKRRRGGAAAASNSPRRPEFLRRFREFLRRFRRRPRGRAEPFQRERLVVALARAGPAGAQAARPELAVGDERLPLDDGADDVPAVETTPVRVLILWRRETGDARGPTPQKATETDLVSPSCRRRRRRRRRPARRRPFLMIVAALAHRESHPLLLAALRRPLRARGKERRKDE